MKKQLLPIYLLLVINCFFYSFSLSAQELITNGTFDTDISSWTLTGPANGWVHDNVNARAEHSENTNASNSLLTQSITIDPALESTFSFTILPVTSASKSALYFSVTVNGTVVLSFTSNTGTIGAVATEGTFTYDNTTTTPNTLNAYTVTIPPNFFGSTNADIVLRAQNCSGGNCAGDRGDIFVDDVSFMQTPLDIIPTLSEWGLIILSLLFMTMGTLYLLQPNFRSKFDFER
ncbi:MAG: IPTL-CTERM sorting domain-containing protein [Chitinophagales bacterium]